MSHSNCALISLASSSSAAPLPPPPPSALPPPRLLLPAKRSDDAAADATDALLPPQSDSKLPARARRSAGDDVDGDDAVTTGGIAATAASPSPPPTAGVAESGAAALPRSLALSAIASATDVLSPKRSSDAFTISAGGLQYLEGRKWITTATRVRRHLHRVRRRAFFFVNVAHTPTTKRSKQRQTTTVTRSHGP